MRTKRQVEATTSNPNSTNALLVAGWVSVNDKLPDNENSLSNDVVLFWSKKDGFPMVGCYDYEFSNWTRLPWEKGYKSLPFNDVTHWMPLLERPSACRQS